MNRSRFATLLAIMLALTAPIGCSADQPPGAAQESTQPAARADQVEQSVARETDAAVTESDESGLPEEVAASDEVMAGEGELTIAQADVQPAETQTTADDAGPAPYRIGDHYTVLTPAQPTSSAPGKIEVAESFMYGCPHCFSFEPFIDKWLPNKPAYVEFVRIPALFNRPARIHARAYYTAETLGILDQTHMAFFRELHVNRKSMTSEDELADFFARFGVDGEKFRSTYNSFAVDTKLRRAETLNRRYRITSTPTIIVNGKYLTNGDKITSYAQYLDIADYLAAREAKRQ